MYIRLAFAMIPELLDTAGEILAALSCRGLFFTRRPLRIIMLFTMVFARKAAGRARRSADALEARCYSPDSQGKPFTPGWKDAAALCLGIGFLATIIIL